MTNFVDESTNTFVEECRREWKRLHVPDPLANEMAVDLAADMREAEADGASAEELLGNAAFDPRSFAESWARERGIVQPPLRDRLIRARIIVPLVGFVALAIAASVAVVLLSSSGSRSPSPAPQTAPAPTTTANATVTLPDVIGLTQSEATTRAQAIGASVSIVYAKSDATHGIVVAEQPAAGSVIARGATLRLTVSR